MSHSKEKQKSRTAGENRIAFTPTALWLGLIALCCFMWEMDHGTILVALTAIFGFPILAIGSLIEAARASVLRKWRCLASLFFAPLVSIFVLSLIANRLIDLDRIHFFVVKYPHQLELRYLRSEERQYHTWNWGLDAPLLGPGVAYNLIYDATGKIIWGRKSEQGNSMFVRPMGANFYLVAETEDNDDVCHEMSDLGGALRGLGLGANKVEDQWRQACELANRAHTD
ncbi:hypothetical protein [Paraburkholderia phosphatilytica]|uniref:hypothetical protein n=1 Tax=Paraburkholderia phosphatilytica TaxID=2282883 RepID=UPI000F5E9DB3|nr:hypothetical protein [Paraburkholderia phosphatilytica]